MVESKMKKSAREWTAPSLDRGRIPSLLEGESERRRDEVAGHDRGEGRERLIQGRSSLSSVNSKKTKERKTRTKP